MTDKQQSQLDKSKEAARKAGADEDEARRDEIEKGGEGEARAREAEVTLPDHLKRNDDELSSMRELVARGCDHPVLMINENSYTSEAGYPDGNLYRQYTAGLEKLVECLGGRFQWRLPVLGQPVGQGHKTDEIIAIWFPSHQAYLDLPSAPGGDENYRLRTLCVERARIHRCPG